MPHVILEGKLSAESVHRDFERFTERTAEGWVLKVAGSYLADSGKTALLDAVVVDGGTRHFLVQIDDREGGVTVRLYPLTDPAKTDGVKRLVARVAARVLALDPDGRVVRTNVAEMGTP